ncbi:hypothetical protein [Amycolatopsis sp. Hca4]|uniref:hypothetical protein n=1 Tax=Amycolatopsis sp. Hca4 TaxID=2742131 RepID=UPI001591B171|nr:hypothetical protein [Amycolatopsis sp. Hca4]QKV74191.1 hypothetical protein HUT10_10750 [Amycolatopsis sp. Hca4]
MTVAHRRTNYLDDPDLLLFIDDADAASQAVIGELCARDPADADAVVQGPIAVRRNPQLEQSQIAATVIASRHPSALRHPGAKSADFRRTGEINHNRGLGRLDHMRSGQDVLSAQQEPTAPQAPAGIVDACAPRHPPEIRLLHEH